jgi:hypothetical protein
VGSIGAPAAFRELVDPLPEGATLVEEPHDPCDVLVVFAVTEPALRARFGAALDLLPPSGGLWVAWPKKRSGVATDLSFAAVQSLGLALGLVDNKVCAIDDTWSGLRFVVRRADRPTRQ